MYLLSHHCPDGVTSQSKRKNQVPFCPTSDSPFFFKSVSPSVMDKLRLNQCQTSFLEKFSGKCGDSCFEELEK